MWAASLLPRSKIYTTALRGDTSASVGPTVPEHGTTAALASQRCMQHIGHVHLVDTDGRECVAEIELWTPKTALVRSDREL